MPAFPLYGPGGQLAEGGGTPGPSPFALPEQQEADGAAAR